MAYVTGAAGSFAALRAALVAACTAAGWTQSGTILHKGTAYVDLVAFVDRLEILGGTGKDGTNALTGAGPAAARMGEIGGDGITWPATYHIHAMTAPDEVYLVVNYNAEFWQYLAFGRSDIQGLPGTGLWYAASLPAGQVNSVTLSAEGGGAGGSRAIAMFFEWHDEGNAFIHHGLDGIAWSVVAYSDFVHGASAGRPAAPKYARQPNAWNAASALIEYQVYVRRPSNKQTLAADLGHARLVRIDNLAPGSLVPDSAPEWKVYPWFRKDATARDGGAFVQHTGTFGWAIRYDGT